MPPRPPLAAPSWATDASPTPSRAEWQARAQARAEAAFDAGSALLADGDLPGAERLLTRAARLARADANVLLLLGSVRLRRNRLREAAADFQAVLDRHDLAEAWLGLAACRLGLGEAAAAAAAWSCAASRNAATLEMLALAPPIAAAAGAAGWLAVDGDGRLHVTPAEGATLSLDGVPMGVPLPAGWQGAARLEARLHGQPLLASPIDLGAIRRLDGFVTASDGGLDGWAWHPGNPERAPHLRVVAAAGGAVLPLPADLPASGIAGLPPLGRPRRFHLPAADLPADGLLHVLGEGGRDLLGSPLDPNWERQSARRVAAAIARDHRGLSAAAPAVTTAPQAADLPSATPPLAAPAALRARRGVDVVIPVYRNCALTAACLDQVFAHQPAAVRVHVVDDASPEPELVRLLDALAARRRIVLHRHDRNRGFPAAANRGILAAGRRDVVLLNADTLVSPDWLAILREAAHAAPDIGSATPLSNDATILSYPACDRANPVPDLAEVRRLAALARTANAGRWVGIPTMHGFCVYLRRDCLDQVGLFREDMFAQGYGEENDLSLRAHALGWRHVAVPGLFIGHHGGASFGPARRSLIERNQLLLERLHPGYAALVARHVAADPLGSARRRMDVLRWRRGRREAGAVLIATHLHGGGVERMVAGRVRAARAAGLRPIILRPVHEAPGLVVVGEGAGERGGEAAVDAYPNLRYRLPDEVATLARLLAADRPQRAELHHLLGHDQAVIELLRRLRVPYDAYGHDYAWFCPRIALIGPERRYCGEPDLTGCEHCIADQGSLLEEPIGVRALVARSAALLDGASRVVSATADGAARLARHFPAIRPIVEPWEDDASWPAPGPVPTAGAALQVAVLGGIGPEKGFDVLLHCVRDARARGLPMRFTVIGHTLDDERLLDAGPVFVTGAYRSDDELAGLIAAERPSLVFLPSIWPETWSYTLSHAWAAGLAVVAFDIGAIAERIRARGHGLLLPLGLSPAAVNVALLRFGREVVEAYGTRRDAI